MKTYDSTSPSALSILLRGPAGGGKTTFALQFPGLWVANCDNNLDGPVRFLKQKGLFKPFHFDNIAKDDTGANVDLDNQWKRLTSLTDAALAKPEIKTIFVDSLTHVDQIVMAWAKKTQKKTELGPFDWEPFKGAIYRYIMSIRDSGKTCIISCHETIEYASDQTIAAYVPMIHTNFKNYFEYLFTDQWLCEIKPSGGGQVKATVSVHPTANRSLKNSLLIDKELREPTYAAVAEAMERASK